MALSNKDSMRFNNYSDEDLCTLIQEGKSSALSVLLRRYSNLVFTKAKTVFCSGMDNEDIYQEGMITLINAAVTYDNGKQASFRTYAFVCISNRFRDLIRKNSLAEFSYCVDASDTVDSPEDDIIIKDDLDRLRSILNTELSAKERSFILDHLAGLSYSEIAEKHKCNVKSVSNALCRVRKKLKFFD